MAGAASLEMTANALHAETSAMIYARVALAFYGLFSLLASFVECYHIIF
jgi:hypothetical protein